MVYEQIKTTLDKNVSLLKMKVSTHAIYGLLIASFAIILATFMVAYSHYGFISLNTLIKSQQHNAAIWVLDFTPFLFAFWGQYVNSIVCYEASAMVLDQTNELRLQTSALESKINHEASHDYLTNLPNRTLLLDRITQAISNARSHHQSLAIIVVNINNFKEVNDALGRHNGDRLLKQIAARLLGATPEPNTLARLNSDEFSILLPTIANKNDAVFFANKMQKALAMSFSLEDITLDINAAMGISLFPEHGSDPDTLLQRAEVAMHASKKQNKNYTIYNTKLDKDSPQRLVIMGELRRAIENDDLLLYYQPKIDFRTGETKSVEALVRWNHETFGIRLADRFVPLA